ncbi:MerR family transcriptional regulator [Terribacillus saccharophilus]|uniref:MerR family transcriptional regulator n=1 Tax=Terribacillus saccharophilus TaxID=361277 RepID=A0A075LI28_9BACI|nr:MerR family transcriptional regulator [Terribacillus goriensis]AIF65557.1 MerR family transcriptional regulator [Terribacillus goriensis]
MLHIHDVRKLTGVTVRTLRHYDHLDLLMPAAKTEGGHRLYGEYELKKLQQIQFLKQIGFSLGEIKSMLQEENWEWTDSIKKQLIYVVQEQQHLHQTEILLRELMNSIALEGQDHLEAIRKLMLLMDGEKTMQDRYKEKVFNQQQMQLLDRVPRMVGHDSDSLEWIGLIGQLKEHMDRGLSDDRVQQIIRRMDEKRSEQFEGEDDFLDKLWEVRLSPEESEKMGLYPIDQDLLHFMEDAYTVFMQSKQKEKD